MLRKEMTGVRSRAVSFMLLGAACGLVLMGAGRMGLRRSTLLAMEPWNGMGMLRSEIAPRYTEQTQFPDARHAEEALDIESHRLEEMHEELHRQHEVLLQEQVQLEIWLPVALNSQWLPVRHT
jgi:hypothetical protein